MPSLFALACRASIPNLPVTAATSIFMAPAVAPPVAWMPAVLVPTTAPVALTEMPPEPLPMALIPIVAPVTAAAVIVSVAAFGPAEPWIPIPAEAVTAPPT